MASFLKYLYPYPLGIDIAAQEKIIKDADKEGEKSIKEGEDVVKKVAENKKDQEDKKTNLQKKRSAEPAYIKTD